MSIKLKQLKLTTVARQERLRESCRGGGRRCEVPLLGRTHLCITADADIPFRRRGDPRAHALHREQAYEQCHAKRRRGESHGLWVRDHP